MPTTLEQLQYGFDRDSRRTWRQRATTQGWDNAYAYDSLSQVTGDDRGDLNLAQNAIAGIPANGARWDYDETGNWHGYQAFAHGLSTLNQARVHDKGNRLMEVEGAADMRTDRAGRMVQAVPGPEQDWSQSWQITWDAWSRITQVSHVEGDDIHKYTYDGITRRTTRYNHLTGTLDSYYNDQWRPVEERKNSETTASMSYLWGARHRDDLIRRDRAVGGTTLNETRYILMDYFSPAAVTDGSGAVKERYQFSAFGLRMILNPDFTPRTASECNMVFSFQGQFQDQETGWMNYGYRYYLPSLGRWASKDPIQEWGGLNLYGMASNNCLQAVDHLGLITCPCGESEDDYGKCCKDVKRYKDVHGRQKCGVGGTKPPKKKDKKNGDDEKECSDDAGRSCKCSQIQTISKYSIPFGTKDHTVGHEGITCPGMASYGQYPASGGLGKVYGPGEFRNDNQTLSIMRAIDPEHLNEKGYRACPETVKMMQQYIRDSLADPDNYSLFNVGGTSCAGWANNALSAVGLTPQKTGGVPVPGGGKQPAPAGTIASFSTP